MVDKPDVCVTIRGEAKPVLKQMAYSYETSQIHLLSKIIIGFSLLQDDERQALLHIGDKGLGMLKADFNYEFGEGFSVPDDMKHYLNEYPQQEIKENDR